MIPGSFMHRRRMYKHGSNDQIMDHGCFIEQVHGKQIGLRQVIKLTESDTTCDQALRAGRIMYRDILRPQTIQNRFLRQEYPWIQEEVAIFSPNSIIKVGDYG
jgi:hypothetical protein